MSHRCQLRQYCQIDLLPMLARMFWRVAGYSQTSPIEAILDKDSFTLEELLDEDDLIQECKSLNDRLVAFLRSPDTILKLIDYIVVAPEGATHLIPCCSRSSSFRAAACQLAQAAPTAHVNLQSCRHSFQHRWSSMHSSKHCPLHCICLSACNKCPSLYGLPLPAALQSLCKAQAWTNSSPFCTSSSAWSHLQADMHTDTRTATS